MIKSIAFGQPSSTDSVTISRDQQRQCIIWHKEGIVKDSIINTKDSVIVLQRSFIQYTDTLITNYDIRLKDSQNKLEEMKKKRRNAFIIGGASSIATFFLTFFLTL
jgi:hypothetical protein